MTGVDNCRTYSFIRFINLFWLISVSYTHLDVYKRQVYASAGRHMEDARTKASISVRGALSFFSLNIVVFSFVVYYAIARRALTVALTPK